MVDMIELVLYAILINNVVLVQFLGQCPFLGVSRRMDTALGMGMAVIFVITMAGGITWIVYNWILIPPTWTGWSYDITYLRTIAFILVIAALVQLVEIVLQKVAPALYRALGIYLPLITTNCAVLGVAITNIDKEYGFFTTIVYSLASAIGYAMALTMFAAIRERLALAHVPKIFEGIAIGLVTAGLMAMAFYGFQGLVTI